MNPSPGVGKHLDTMCVSIEMDRETSEFVDFFFIARVREQDPRSKKRLICTGERRGLFRVHKADLRIELLFAMDLDHNARCFHHAAARVLSVYEKEGAFPRKAQFASG